MGRSIGDGVEGHWWIYHLLLLQRCFSCIHVTTHQIILLYVCGLLHVNCNLINLKTKQSRTSHRKCCINIKCLKVSKVSPWHEVSKRIVTQLWTMVSTEKYDLGKDTDKILTFSSNPSAWKVTSRSGRKCMTGLECKEWAQASPKLGAMWAWRGRRTKNSQGTMVGEKWMELGLWWVLSICTFCTQLVPIGLLSQVCPL